MNWNLIFKVALGVAWFAVPGSVIVSALYVAVRKKNWYKRLEQKVVLMIELG